MKNPGAYIAPPLSEGVVTFLDVLGWRGVYNRIPHATVRLSILVEGLREEAERQSGKVFGRAKVKSISDTIAIFTECRIDEVSTAIDSHGEMASYLIRESIDKEIPVRGAIAYGEFSIHETIFVGKAVDEAAAWHEHADWIGVHLTPSAEFVFSDTNQDGLWAKYSPPNKSPMRWEPHCVNWTQGWTDRDEEVGKIKDKFRALGPIVPEIAPKLINTLHFIDSVS